MCWTVGEISAPPLIPQEPTILLARQPVDPCMQFIWARYIQPSLLDSGSLPSGSFTLGKRRTLCWVPFYARQIFCQQRPLCRVPRQPSAKKSNHYVGAPLVAALPSASHPGTRQRSIFFSEKFFDECQPSRYSAKIIFFSKNSLPSVCEPGTRQRADFFFQKILCQVDLSHMMLINQDISIWGLLYPMRRCPWL